MSRNGWLNACELHRQVGGDDCRRWRIVGEQRERERAQQHGDPERGIEARDARVQELDAAAVLRGHQDHEAADHEEQRHAQGAIRRISWVSRFGCAGQLRGMKEHDARSRDESQQVELGNSVAFHRVVVVGGRSVAGKLGCARRSSARHGSTRRASSAHPVRCLRHGYALTLQCLRRSNLRDRKLHLHD